MKPPEKVELFETIIATCWLDELGIFNMRSKQVKRTVESYSEIVKLFIKLTEKNKLCVLVDSSEMTPLSKEVRNFMTSELPKHFKALAIISTSPLGRMIANTFIVLKQGSFPVRMFGNEHEAKEWLKKYV